MMLSLPVASQSSMSARFDNAQGSLDLEQFDCVSTGEKWREYKTDALKVLAGKCDDSGSSLADHMLGVDMGGPNPGAIPMPAAGRMKFTSTRPPVTWQKRGSTS